MDVLVMIWGILRHVNFSYNIWEFLQFFPELCDTQGPLGGPQGPRGGPPEGVPLAEEVSVTPNLRRDINMLISLQDSVASVLVTERKRVHSVLDFGSSYQKKITERKVAAPGTKVDKFCFPAT